MIDITFITSNQTKLAHARYLCRDYDVNILQYKKLFYGVGYQEPRIYDRDELLKESFDDAMKRWKNNVCNYGDRLFFIEDTSVRIDALSDEKNEVPGVDIKYWMMENSFDSLDKELRKRGNNRKVSVSSHIVLFLTDELRERVNTQEKYRIFKSTSYGHIVEKEEPFETNILYPWLDNGSFNKWFVPSGFNVPISRLRIEDANEGDFRKGAFEEMLSYLSANDQIVKLHKKQKINPKIQYYTIFIVCGQTCSGKSTIGKYLVDKFDYYHIEASDFMTLHYLETHGTNSFIDKNLFAKAVLGVNPNYVVDQLLEYMQTNNIYDKFIITGFRSNAEVEKFINEFPSQRIHVIFFRADFETRCERWICRHRDNEKYTSERFKEIDNIQNAIGVQEISKMKNVHIFDNNMNNISEFQINFRQLFLHDNFEEEKPYDENKIFNLKDLSLEKAILITLALEYQKDETTLFTTTEISKQIKLTFKNIDKKKDNISRYFNQSHHLYYETKKVNGKNKYRISPTGYSEAFRIMKKLSVL
ncbi:MAG: AAA family ATPase [Paludibacteraceae bacterium]|nr:AAA family ATPase [Paludibacteraceae bacterium]